MLFSFLVVETKFEFFFGQTLGDAVRGSVLQAVPSVATRPKFPTVEKCWKDEVCLPAVGEKVSVVDAVTAPFNLLWRFTGRDASEGSPKKSESEPAKEVGIAVDVYNDPGAGWLLLALVHETGFKIPIEQIESKGNGDGVLTADEVFRYVDQNPQLDFRGLAGGLEEEHAAKAASYAAYLDGKTALEGKDLGSARKHFEGAVKLDPANALAVRALGILDARDANADRRQEGIALLGQAQDLGLAPDAEILEATADYFAAEGDLKLAVKVGRQRIALGFKDAQGNEDWTRRDPFDIKVAGWARHAGDLITARDILWPEDFMGEIVDKFVREHPDQARPCPTTEQLGITQSRTNALLDLHADENKAWREEAEKREAGGDYAGAIELWGRFETFNYKGFLILGVPRAATPDRAYAYGSQFVLALRDQAGADAFNANFLARGGDADPVYSIMSGNMHDYASGEIARLSTLLAETIKPNSQLEAALPKDIQYQIYDYVMDRMGIPEDALEDRAILMAHLEAKGLDIPEALLIKIEEARRKAESTTGKESVAATEEMNRYVAVAAQTALVHYLREESRHLDVSGPAQTATFHLVYGALNGDEDFLVKGGEAVDEILTYVTYSEPVKEEGFDLLAPLWPAESALVFETDMSKNNFHVREHRFTGEEPHPDYLGKLYGIETAQGRFFIHKFFKAAGLQAPNAEDTEKLMVDLPELHMQARFEETKLNYGAPRRLAGYDEGPVRDVQGLRRLNAHIDRFYGGDHIQGLAEQSEEHRRAKALKENKHYQDTLDLEDGMADLSLFADFLHIKNEEIDAVTVEDLVKTRGDLVDRAKGLKAYHVRQKEKAAEEVQKDDRKYSYGFALGKVHRIDYDAARRMSRKERDEYFKGITGDDLFETGRLLGNLADLEAAERQIAEIDGILSELKKPHCTNKTLQVERLQGLTRQLFVLKEEEVRTLIEGEIGVAGEASQSIKLGKVKYRVHGAIARDERLGIERCYKKEVEDFGNASLDVVGPGRIWSELNALQPLDPTQVSSEEIHARIQAYETIRDDAGLVMTYAGLEELANYYEDHVIGDVNDAQFIMFLPDNIVHWISGDDPIDVETNSEPVLKTTAGLRAIQADLLDPQKRADANIRATEIMRAHVHAEHRALHKSAVKTKIVADVLAITAAAITAGRASGLAVRGVTGLWRAYRTYKVFNQARKVGQTAQQAYRMARTLAAVEEMGAGMQFTTRVVGGATNATAFTTSEPVFAASMSRQTVRQAWGERFGSWKDVVYQSGTNWMMFGGLHRLNVGVSKGYQYVLGRSAARSMGGIKIVRGVAGERLAARGVEVTKGTVRSEVNAMLAEEVGARASRWYHKAGHWTVGLGAETAGFQAWGFGKDVGLDQTGQVLRGDRDSWDVQGAYETHLRDPNAWWEGTEVLLGLRFANGVTAMGGKALEIGATGLYEARRFAQNGARLYQAGLGGREALRGARTMNRQERRERREALGQTIADLDAKIADMEQVSRYFRNADYRSAYEGAVVTRERLINLRDAEPIAMAFLGKGNDYGVRFVQPGIYEYSHGSAGSLIKDLAGADRSSPHVLNVLDVKPNGTIVAEFTGPQGEKIVIRLIPDGKVPKSVIDRRKSDFVDEETLPDGLPVGARATVSGPGKAANDNQAGPANENR